ncbi:hypothetical protein MGMO_4c00050 [Methyloglobulus morosus KoM1]|uniref:Uncharacterized protein n=1 Tax=Methyloglobulus morosus KoM1 TaxID=1116472 RepID=V5CBA8_9GAMM|nr:hypothetical protein MGMO_4c00050 [Methyloglobulus morosus KoM1]
MTHEPSNRLGIWISQKSWHSQWQAHLKITVNSDLTVCGKYIEIEILQNLSNTYVPSYSQFDKFANNLLEGYKSNPLKT